MAKCYLHGPWLRGEYVRFSGCWKLRQCCFIGNVFKGLIPVVCFLRVPDLLTSPITSDVFLFQDRKHDKHLKQLFASYIS